MRRTVHHAGAWGPVGSVFAALCCLGVAPVVAALGTVGLGFLVDDRILLALLALSLGATLWALENDRVRHGRNGPTIAGVLGAAATVAGLWLSGTLAGTGLFLIVAGSVWNWVLVRRGEVSTGG